MDVNHENLMRMLNEASGRTIGAVEQFSFGIKKIRWKTVSFTIPTTPEPSHRPRLCGYRVYVPGAAKNQSFFDKNVRPTLGGLFITTPCQIIADAYMETPKSFTQTQKILAEMRLIRPWTNSGDVDNISKALYDMMGGNKKRGIKGIMIDDCIVVDSITRLYYSATPRYEVTIKYMSNVDAKLMKLLRIDRFIEEKGE